MSRRSLPTPAGPAERGALDGLAYTLWLPDRPPWGGLVVIHGAGSCKESHHDMARSARAAGMAAVCFDLRGHGETGGELDGRVLEDVAAVAGLLPRPIALRGSSLGGFLAIAAAERAGAAAMVAVCPAPASLLLGGLRSGRLDFPVDRPAAEAVIAEHDPLLVAEQSTVPLMLLHAEGDERVPYESSVEIHRRSAASLKRLIVVPGGHHRSVQHDEELQGEALRFVRRALRPATPSPPPASPG
jgi:alpha-beta hydrolase superfamily lysophospholipase